MKPPIDPNKIVIFSGSGVSAESGLPTFRDADGLWRTYSWREVASAWAWKEQPELVLEFYNERRNRASKAEPNAAHLAIASLEAEYTVVVITQNVDDLHERAGSTRVLHLHGQLAYARGSGEVPRRYRIDSKPISIGQLCEDGTQLRPDIVLFGEAVPLLEHARQQTATAARFLVVGTSLSVYPAASLVKAARGRAQKVLVALDMETIPYGFIYRQGSATTVVPRVAASWMRDALMR